MTCPKRNFAHFEINSATHALDASRRLAAPLEAPPPPRLQLTTRRSNVFSTVVARVFYLLPIALPRRRGHSWGTTNRSSLNPPVVPVDLASGRILQAVERLSDVAQVVAMMMKPPRLVLVAVCPSVLWVVCGTLVVLFFV